MQIGILVFPGFNQLDLSGPYEVLSRLSGATVHLLWKHRETIVSDTGLPILATRTFYECPPLDVVVVPGGPGQVALMEDEEVLYFLRKQAKDAKFVTSVCTGSLVLAAAGLLKGCHATTHWLSMEFLRDLGVQVSNERIVFDGNRITASGVTAGIDFGLALAAKLRGEDEAKRIQLLLEYDPHPPFNTGTPETAGPALEKQVRESGAELLARRRAVTDRLRNNKKNG